MQLKARIVLLLSPALILFCVFLFLPLALVVVESFRTYIPGRVGSAVDAPFTLFNYMELALPVYVGYFVQTYILAFCSSAIGVIIAFPVAYHIARRPSAFVRKIWISGIVGLMFLSALVLVYSIQMTLGPIGAIKPILTSLGVNTSAKGYIYFVVIAGLTYYSIPLSVLVLIGVVQNLNPKLHEAAESLGASRLQSHLSVTLPLSAKGISSAFIISLTGGISAFVIPWILGRGRILFVSNLIYSRFGEIANYPSGAAISMVMLLVSGLVIFAASRLATHLERQ